jgi:hypothetical protein
LPKHMPTLAYIIFDNPISFPAQYPTNNNIQLAILQLLFFCTFPNYNY